MDSLSKIILSNGKEYIVSIQLGSLIGKTLVNSEGEFLNTFVVLPHIDVETGNEMQVALNPRYIVAIEESNIRMQPHVPSVFRIEKILKDLEWKYPSGYFIKEGNYTRYHSRKMGRSPRMSLGPTGYLFRETACNYKSHV